MILGIIAFVLSFIIFLFIILKFSTVSKRKIIIIILLSIGVTFLVSRCQAKNTEISYLYVQAEDSYKSENDHLHST